MHLLVINPNISESVTALIATEARRAAAPGTVVTDGTGSAVIELGATITTTGELVMNLTSPS